MLSLSNISKCYNVGGVKVSALTNITLNISDGEFVAIMGASGSGKSTLLNILGCMDTPTSGTYILNGTDVSNLKPKDLCNIRTTKLTFVFQNFALMEKYTAYENIELPLTNKKISVKTRRKMIFEVAKKLKIDEQLKKMPKQMSGGQQQRIAIARALVSGADIILADEPTGALDQQTGRELMEIFQSLNESGKTIIIVTHDHNVAKYAKRIITICDGRIINESL